MSELKFTFRYSVQIIRSGQPRPYANTEREYKLFCERFQAWGKPEEQGWHPCIPEVAALQPKDIDAYGVPTNEYSRKRIDAIVRGTCQNFYRSMDEPGSDWAAPILKWMKIDAKAGIIHVFITEEYTD